MAYHESLLQWIWKQVEFDCQNLITVCGKKVKIIDPGKINHGAGPDFLQSKLNIDGINWFGDVEIHKEIKNWSEHNHQTDKNFNSVILHVVYEAGTGSQCKREDGTEPLTLELRPYISKSLETLFLLKKKRSIPCGGTIEFLNQQAFEEQIKRAHLSYLNYKTEELIAFYNSNLRLSEAWKNMMIIGIYRALGIPVNQQPMEELARVMTETYSGISPGSPELMLRNAEAEAKKQIWESAGMRPASRPGVRREQAVWLHEAILKTPFSHFLQTDSDHWHRITNNIPMALKPGRERMDILKYTVFIPSLYLLGDFVASKQIKDRSFKMWNSEAQQIPQEIKKPFKNAGFLMTSNTTKLGLAHQYKRYCQEGRCQQCFVFKSAIRS